VPVSVTVTGVTSSPLGSGVIITQTGGSPAFAWAVSDLAVGAGGVITLTGTLTTSAAIYGTQFTNTATIAASTDITMSNNSSGAGVSTPSVLSTATGGTGSGSVSFDPAGGIYTYGTVVTLTATADTGSSFAGWSGDVVSPNSPVTLTMDGNKAVSATFTLNSYALTTATMGTGSGSVSLNPAGGTYIRSTVVEVTATPATDSTFTGWDGACTGTGACRVKMDGAKTVTAVFALEVASPEGKVYVPVLRR
jgi:hypothetical protein